MKKFKCFMLVLFAFACAGGFTACSNDDDDDKGKDEPLKAEIKYSYAVTQDLFDVADITITYYGESNEKKTIKMTKIEWTHSFTIEKFPATVGYKVAVALKEGVALEKASYKIGESQSDFIEVGESLKSVTSNLNLTISKENLRKYLIDHSFGKANEYIIEEDGTYYLNSTPQN